MKVGLYLHIPFCKSRCIYCDFYSTTSHDKREKYVANLCKEIAMKRALIGSEALLSSIYFGGGTPSLLSLPQLEALFGTIRKYYTYFSPEIEITLEANPDDITTTYAKGIHNLGINRVSLGVQSFHDQQLSFLGRRHNAQQVVEAIETLHKVGIDNISIDLIYGLPEAPLTWWETTINKAIALHPSHISAYALTYEVGTKLSRLATKGEILIKNDDEVYEEYNLLIRKLAEAGYVHYEISNFALPHREAIHNSSYWEGIPYLGVGPSAHSYITLCEETILRKECFQSGDKLRFANMAQLTSYEREIERGYIPIDFIEKLSFKERYEETLMLRLRTQKGIDLSLFNKDFGTSCREQLIHRAQPYIDQGLLLYQRDRLAPTERGFFVIDGIISSLFL